MDYAHGVYGWFIVSRVDYRAHNQVEVDKAEIGDAHIFTLMDA